ncbi:hypothetical protein PTTG_29189, partial [Puccinia triticina 1-1 BBBD Race 1]
MDHQPNLSSTQMSYPPYHHPSSELRPPASGGTFIDLADGRFDSANLSLSPRSRTDGKELKILNHQRHHSQTSHAPSLQLSSGKLANLGSSKEDDGEEEDPLAERLCGLRCYDMDRRHPTASSTSTSFPSPPQPSSCPDKHPEMLEETFQNSTSDEANVPADQLGSLTASSRCTLLFPLFIVSQNIDATKTPAARSRNGSPATSTTQSRSSRGKKVSPSTGLRPNGLNTHHLEEEDQARAVNGRWSHGTNRRRPWCVPSPSRPLPIQPTSRPGRARAEVSATVTRSLATPAGPDLFALPAPARFPIHRHHQQQQLSHPGPTDPASSSRILFIDTASNAQSSTAAADSGAAAAAAAGVARRPGNSFGCAKLRA